MAAEKNFENKIKTWLEEQGIYPFGTEKQKMIAEPVGYYEKRWGGSKYTKSGLPDMHVVVKGYSLEVELKAPNGKPSVLQLHNLKQIDDSGGKAILLYPNYELVFKNLILCILAEDFENAAFNYKILKGRWST